MSDYDDDYDEAPPVPDMDGKPSFANRRLTPEAQGSNTPLGFKPTLEKPMAAVRCTASIRNGPKEGQRCGKWSILGSSVCLQHGGHLPNVRAAAEERVNELRRRIIEGADKAVDTLFDLTEPGIENNVRLGAAKEIAALAGLKNGPDLTVEVQHTSPSSIINERLAQIRERSIEQAEKDHDDIIDAELDEAEKEE